MLYESMRLNLVIVLAVVLSGCPGPSDTAAPGAAPGSLDAGFGGGSGIATAGPLLHDNYGHDLAIRPDGEIILAGYSRQVSTGLANFSWVCIPEDGTYISGCIDGYQADFNGIDDIAYGVALQADGKVVLAGQQFKSATTSEFGSVRFTTGIPPVLDTSYSVDGKTTDSISFGNGAGRDVAVLPDGKILVAGWSVTDVAAHMRVLRYNSNGTLDTTFGDADSLNPGKRKGYATFGPAGSYAHAMAIQDDGKIVVAGYYYAVWNNTTTKDMIVSRLNIDGTPDTTFGLSGNHTIAFTAYDAEANAVAIDSLGRIIVVGQYNKAGGCCVSVYRVDSSGGFAQFLDLDEGDLFTFGNAVAVTADDNIIVVGNSMYGTASHAFIMRINGNGTGAMILDTTFGTGGVSVHPTAGTTGNAVAIQSDDKLLMGGSSDWSGTGGRVFMVTRFNP
ncbi:MAG: hypothetical protein OEZ10_05785 [Gammaproteobacteria bacterium]|nr:hypothetical protein [Gammaproteobacteria bacterium]